MDKAEVQEIADAAAQAAVASFAGFMLQRWKEDLERYRQEPTLGPHWIVQQLVGGYAAALGKYGQDEQEYS